ncbi:photosystem I reaction center subunit psaK [Populus alba x Populus x berolinensis]|uniref:PSI-K n=1 Tax=Populus alba x Populus x berolinensis TaxID=444605 RepID=A0AAD6LAV1_9ROSI|nr:photosystem I reaction center subunit psaK [Populus alba x Populus x berolinensis]
MVASTSLMLFAGRFGLAPSANRKATAGLKLEVRDSGLQTGDLAGFTLADTLACGAVGHIIGVGVVLGLKNMDACCLEEQFVRNPSDFQINFIHKKRIYMCSYILEKSNQELGI